MMTKQSRGNARRADIDELYAKTRTGGSGTVSVKQYDEGLSGTVGPSGSVKFQSTGSIVVGPSGKVNLVAGCTVGAGGGTGAAGDEIHFQIQFNGSPLGGADQFGELTQTHKLATATLPGTISGLTPGSTCTLAIVATDQNGGNTIVMQTAYLQATSF